MKYERTTNTGLGIPSPSDKSEQRDREIPRCPPACYGPGILRCSPHIERAAHGEVSATGNAGDGETRTALALPARVAERDTRPAEQSDFSTVRHRPTGRLSPVGKMG